MAEQCARKSNENSENGSGPIGDDAEPNVEMRNDEDGEPLEAEVPRGRMNPKNPTSREKQQHEDSGHAVCSNWCAALSKVEELVDNIEFNCLRKRKEKERLPPLPLITFS